MYKAMYYFSSNVHHLLTTNHSRCSKDKKKDIIKNGVDCGMVPPFSDRVHCCVRHLDKHLW